MQRNTVVPSVIYGIVSYVGFILSLVLAFQQSDFAIFCFVFGTVFLVMALYELVQYVSRKGLMGTIESLSFGQEYMVLAQFSDGVGPCVLLCRIENPAAKYSIKLDNLLPEDTKRITLCRRRVGEGETLNLVVVKPV